VTPQRAILDGHQACTVVDRYKSVGLILVDVDGATECVKDNRITLLA